MAEIRDITSRRSTISRILDSIFCCFRGEGGKGDDDLVVTRVYKSAEALISHETRDVLPGIPYIPPVQTNSDIFTKSQKERPMIHHKKQTIRSGSDVVDDIRNAVLDDSDDLEVITIF